ncbi:CARDB domain-containing protein [Halococcus sp. AFM35]|uniref:CARDB domain-containing protein n=1 Tax=Halococcus sp. AFM35 TaxID=3421653 RepID=UPI003EBF0FD0
MAQSALLNSLDEVRAALKDEDYERLDAELDAYQAAYQESLLTERLTLRRSQLSRTEMDISSETQTILTEYENQQGGTNTARAGLLAGGDILLFDPESADSSELVGGVSDLRNQETALNDRMTAARGAISDFDLPARIALLSAEPETRSPVFGSMVSIDVTVANIGDASAENVSLSVESSLPVSPSETTLGSVVAEETETVSVAVTANEPGEHEVTFTAKTTNADTESVSASITVL